MNAGESVLHEANDQQIVFLIKQYLSDEEWALLVSEAEQVVRDPTPNKVARIFATLPRKIKNGDAKVSRGEITDVGPNEMPLIVRDWSLTRLIRVWVLMHLPPNDRSAYVKLIEQLFIYGEVEELVALYSALPLYHYPEVWHQRCAEGIRSNMGSVREAVLIDNYYPSRFLDDSSWNQLVLKGFFTDEYMLGIVGLAERNNETLAHTLIDYAYERSAAHRDVHPVLWVLVAPYINERAFALMTERLGKDGNLEERQAIAYAFGQTDFFAAVQWLEKSVETKELLNQANLPWASLGGVRYKK